MRTGSLVAQRLEALERQREMRSPLVARDGMDLVDDQGLGGAQQLAALLARDEQVERLGSRHDERRRLAQHRGALRLRGVAGAHRDGQLRRLEPVALGDGSDLAEGALEVLRDVDGERLQRRDVHDAGRALERGARLVLAVQTVDADEEPGEGLPGPGRRGDQGVGACCDVRPSLALRLGRAVREAPAEPLGDGGVEAVERPRAPEGELAGKEGGHFPHLRAGM